MVRSAPTRGEDVYARLRADILAGRLKPGIRLPFAELCARYDTSVGVVREGLSRLGEQGLVLAEPQQGYRVTPISAEDLRHLTNARTSIETLVLQSAIDSGGVAWESAALAAHHTLQRTSQQEPDDPQRMSEAWAAAHAAFHASLLGGCPNPRLRGIALALRDSAELYRRWSLPVGHDHNRDIAAEHRELLHAVLARNAEQATTLLAAHIERTASVLLEAANANNTLATA